MNMFDCPLRLGQRVRHTDYQGRRVTGVIVGLSIDHERGLMVDCALDKPIVIPAMGHYAATHITRQHAQAHEFTPFDDRDDLISQLRAAVASYQRLCNGAPYLMDAVRAARACIQQDRAALADVHMNPATNTVDDEGAEGLAEYDAVLQQIDAAIQRCEGGAA